MPFPLPKRREARIELAPMVDVVFNLLIFFFVTTTFLTDKGIPLTLPEAKSAEPAAKQGALTVRVSADGAIRFRDRMVSLADLEADLRRALDSSEGREVTIEGDGRVDYETIVKVMDVARRAKAPGIVLATREPPPPTPAAAPR